MTDTKSLPARFSYPAADGLQIQAYRWQPAAPVRGIIQIAHGMGEHAQRYGHLAEALTSVGFVVYAQDHRGHGNTAPSNEALGQVGPDGWAALLDDIDRLVTYTKAEQPGRPLVLLGHSMGSFALQQYLPEHSDRADAVVLTGTGLLDLMEPALDLDQQLDLAMFNASFEPGRTGFEWLSRDEAEVDAYVADPRCGFGLDLPGVRAMFIAARELAKPERLAMIRADLPLYIAAGEDDPVNAQLALVQALIDRYKAAGLTDITFRSYSGARHELFNETNRDEVIADLLGWLERFVPAR